MNQPSINIVILNWNGYKDTSELLESLFKVTYGNYKVIVVDNNSSNSEAEKIDKVYQDRVNIIRCKENLGFAGGNNVGINYSLEEKADFILLINNDTTVVPDFLEILVSKFKTENQAGIIAPRINYYDRPEKIWTEGGKISRIRGSGFAYSDKLESETNSFDRSVSFVSGCCMLIKRDVFLKVGLFDENYFLYTEDTDLCFRTIKAGYKIYVTPRSKIFHKVNSSTKSSYSTLPLYYTTRNRLYFAQKNFGNTFILTFIYLLLTMIIKSLGWLFLGRFNNIISVYNAFIDFFNGKVGKTNHKKFEHE